MKLATNHAPFLNDGRKTVPIKTCAGDNRIGLCGSAGKRMRVVNSLGPGPRGGILRTLKATPAHMGDPGTFETGHGTSKYAETAASALVARLEKKLHTETNANAREA